MPLTTQTVVLCPRTRESAALGLGTCIPYCPQAQMLLQNHYARSSVSSENESWSLVRTGRAGKNIHYIYEGENHCSSLGLCG